MTETRKAILAISLLVGVAGFAEAISRPEAQPTGETDVARQSTAEIPADAEAEPDAGEDVSLSTPSPVFEPTLPAPVVAGPTYVTTGVCQSGACSPSTYAVVPQQYQPQRRRFAILPRNRR